MKGTVLAVACHGRHRLSKSVVPSICLLAGLGVEGDAHLGERVKHRSRARFAPHAPNLRQVHLIHGELLDELRASGFDVGPGVMGENVTTWGLALLDLFQGTRLRLGADALVELTGLRNPCIQLERHQPGLMEAVLDRAPGGQLIRKAGVMSIVLAGGVVAPGDEISVELPVGPYRSLQPV